MSRSLYFRYKHSYRFSTGREPAAAENWTRQTPALLGCCILLQYTSPFHATQRKPHTEAPGCTTLLLQNDRAVIFHLLCLTTVSTSSGSTWRTFVQAGLMGSAASQGSEGTAASWHSPRPPWDSSPMKDTCRENFHFNVTLCQCGLDMVNILKGTAGF